MGEVPDELRWTSACCPWTCLGIAAGTKYRGEFEERIKKHSGGGRPERGNVILFIG
ncbi:MAG: hypothetical protein ACLT9P_07030 [Evtepia gabavorous]